MSSPYITAIQNNRKWSAALTEADPSYFPTNALSQNPPILWIGCSDSRVPETTVTGFHPGPGVLFTHRNIANMVHPDTFDLSLDCVLRYAVESLGIKHIMLVGHTNCGGCIKALQPPGTSPLDKWLAQLVALRQAHQVEIDRLDGVEAQAKRLAELNTEAGARALERRVAGSAVEVHRVVYDLGRGWLVGDDWDLVVQESGEEERGAVLQSRL